MVPSAAILDLIDDPSFVDNHPNDAIPQLRRFLSASMDEVRLAYANEYAQAVLRKRDLDDAGHFRHAVLRKEINADVGYPDQRDHSAHTLYNYLLGWWFWIKCPRFREVAKEHWHVRTGRDLSLEEQSNAFANVWIWASLLHDVGYMFEGGIGALDSRVQDERIRHGANVANDYFEHRLWMEIGFPSRSRRSALLKALGLETPRVESHSLAAVADSLRALPAMDFLQTGVRVSLGEREWQVPDEFFNSPLPRDVFELWARNYEMYQQPEMAERVRQSEKIFCELIWSGLPKAGLRLLDHGVCSGLLLAQYSTFYFAVLAGTDQLRVATPPNPLAEEAWRALSNRGFRYQCAYWWTWHMWGTAAAAIHNLVQLKSPVQGVPRVAALVVEQDPIAYLGVLVDIVQDWDRYRARRGGVLLAPGTMGRLPLQSVDVGLREVDGRLCMSVGEPRPGSLRDELDHSLTRWEEFVTLEPT